MLGANALGCRHGSNAMAISTDAGDSGAPAGGDAGDEGPTPDLGTDAPPAAGPPPGESWARTFDRGMGYADRARAVAMGADGTVVVAGETQQVMAPGDLDVWVRKYDAAGNELWTRTYDSAPGDGLGDDQGYAVAVDGSGAVVVTGVAHRKLWLRRYDPSGTESWTVTGETGAGRGLAIDESGNVVVAGESIGLRKYDGQGTEILRKPTPGLDAAALALAPDGSIAIVGSTPAIRADLVVRKLGAGGDELWSRSFDGGGDDRGFAVAVDGAGNVIAGGTAFSPEQTRQTLWLRKYDGAGAALWTRDGEYGSAVAIVSDATGALVVADGLAHSFVLRKYDGAGNVLWATSNGPDVVGRRYPLALALGDQGLAVAGWVTVKNMVFAPPEDVFVVKYGP
ncbi:MAG TPA: hypothetical protein VN914_21785 [Polyangia bacterium]|nr:hypothetical protein [Polyangia bacterium]